MYVAKLGEVKALGGPVEARAANAAALPAAADALRRTCQVRERLWSKRCGVGGSVGTAGLSLLMPATPCCFQRVCTMVPHLRCHPAPNLSLLGRASWLR